MAWPIIHFKFKFSLSSQNFERSKNNVTIQYILTLIIIKTNNKKILQAIKIP